MDASVTPVTPVTVTPVTPLSRLLGGRVCGKGGGGGGRGATPSGLVLDGAHGGPVVSITKSLFIGFGGLVSYVCSIRVERHT